MRCYILPLLSFKHNFFLASSRRYPRKCQADVLPILFPTNANRIGGQRYFIHIMLEYLDSIISEPGEVFHHRVYLKKYSYKLIHYLIYYTYIYKNDTFVSEISLFDIVSLHLNPLLHEFFSLSSFEI